MEDLKTTDILIRAAEPGDAMAISALLGQIGTYEGTLQLPDMPVASRVDTYQHVDAQGCKLVALSAGEVIGFAGLHLQQPSLRRSHVRSLAIALAPQGQGRGIGKMLMTRVLDWADNWGGVLRIELMVQADNKRAISLYRGLGFVEEGRHKGYALTGGRYVDSLSMARLHPNPPRING